MGMIQARCMTPHVPFTDSPVAGNRRAYRSGPVRSWLGAILKALSGARLGTALIGVGMVFLGQGTRAAAPPWIAPIPDQVTSEDQPILHVPYTVSDPDSPVDRLTFLKDLSLSDTYVSPESLVLGGNGSNRWFSFYPPPNVSGLLRASITVQDDTGLSATAAFQVQIIPVNDAPQFSAIPDQQATWGQGFFTVPFQVSDAELPPFRLRLSARSSRQAVLRDSAIRVQSGSPSNRLLISLARDTVPGSTAITIQADDGTATNSATFILNVREPDFFSTDQSLPGADPSFKPVWGDFNGDGRVDLLISSSLILTNRGSGLFAAGIALPQGPAASGAAAADFDGDGNLDLILFGNSSPRLLRNSGGAVPTFSEVPIDETPFSPFGSPLEWADMDGDGALDIVGGTSRIRWLRNEGSGRFTAVDTGVPSANQPGMNILAVGDFDNDGIPDVLAVAGTATANPVLVLYRNDGTGRLVDSQVSLPGRDIKAGGWVDADGDGFWDLWLVQSPPALPSTNTLMVLSQNEGRFSETYRFTDAAGRYVSWIPIWADLDNDGRVDFVGPYRAPPARNFNGTNFASVYRNTGAGQFFPVGLPVTGVSVSLVPAVMDFDDDGSPDLLSRSGTLLRPLRNQAHPANALPDAPNGLRGLANGNLLWLEWNTALDANQSSALTYNVRVGSRPGRNDVVASMSKTTGFRQIPAPGNAGFNRWFIVQLPLERLDVETLYWSVQAVDNGLQGGPFAAEQTVLIQAPGNQPPAITGLADLSIPEDSPSAITFYVSDDRTAPDLLHVQVASSDTNLFPAGNLALSGFIVTNQALQVNLRLIPGPNQTGRGTITITATDRAGLSTSRYFYVTVTPVNDPPTLVVADRVLAVAGSLSPEFRVTAFDLESALEDLTLSAQSLTPDLVPDANISIRRTPAGWQVAARPTGSQPAEALLRLTVTDPDGGQSSRNVAIVYQRLGLSLVASGTNLPAPPSPLMWADLDGNGTLELLAGTSLGLTIYAVQADRLVVLARLADPAAPALPVDAADFDNDGKVDLLVEVSPPALPRQLIAYRNLGNFAFEPVPGATFPSGPAGFADFDRDGRADVLVAASATNLLVYRNNGKGFDPPRAVPLPAAAGPELPGAPGLIVVDLDGDGLGELVLRIQDDSSGPLRQYVFRRQGDSFLSITNDWTHRPILDVADFDQDQAPDLLTNPGGVGWIQVWRNDGTLNFIELPGEFAQRAHGAVAADFDGDGHPDVFPLGGDLDQLYLGGDGLAFTPIEVPFTQAGVVAAAAGDFDGDGVPDLAVSTYTEAPPAAVAGRLEIYRGTSIGRNHPPFNPGNLRATPVSADTVLFSWNRAPDPDQPAGLTYNVRVGSAPGRADIVSPMSMTNGRRLLPRRGNADWSTRFILSGLQPSRTFYWSVQALDSSFTGGAFAVEDHFSLPVAQLSLRPNGSRGLELELRATPGLFWQVETSPDLRTWQSCPDIPGIFDTGPAGVLRIEIDAPDQPRFFRARRTD